MTNPKGYRRGTRHLFARDFKKNGRIPLATYMKIYKRGDIVDIKVCLNLFKFLQINIYLYNFIIGQWCCTKRYATSILSWKNRSCFQCNSTCCWHYCQQTCSVRFCYFKESMYMIYPNFSHRVIAKRINVRIEHSN